MTTATDTADLDTADAIITRINSLQDRLQFAIYFGECYTRYEDKTNGLLWTCSMKFKDSGTQIEITRHGASPMEVVTECWHELNRIVSTGLPKSVLVAPVTQQLEDRTDEL